MKILQLKLKNINSLVGVHEIDFTDAAFSQDGLFAITGPTGAGKTSILDAIALALYGRTPRVDVTGSENPIMSKGEKDCFAEITFFVNGKIWKSSWKQAINRNGNLNPVKRMIADEKDEIHADQARTCDSKIIEILGLTFEQFTKVIMLAQGNFAAFLQADKNEKGKLLEQLTGTEIYGQISRKVFERHSEEKAKLERIVVELGAIQVLSVEEVAQVQQEMERLQQEQIQVSKILDQLDAASTWLRQINELKKQIDELHVQLPQLKEQHEAALKDVYDAQQLWEAAQEQKTSLTPILNKVRSLDTQLQDRRRQMSRLKQQMEAAQEKKVTHEQDIERIKITLSEAERHLDDQQMWAQKHSHYQELVGDYTSILQENNTVEQIQNELQSIRNEVEGLQKELTNKKAHISESIQAFERKNAELDSKKALLEKQKNTLLNLLNGQSINNLRETKEAIIHSGQLIKELITIENSIKASQDTIQKNEQLIQEETKVLEQLDIAIRNKQTLMKSLENNIQTEEENILLRRTIQSLEEHRHALKDNQPCPLCGALAHPYAVHEPIIEAKDDELKELRETFAHTKQALEMDQHEKIKRGSKIDHATQVRADEMERIVLQRKQQEELLKELEKDNIPALNSPDTVVLEHLEALREKKLAEYEHIQSILKEVDAADQAYSQLRDQEIPFLETQVRHAEKAKIDNETDYQLLRNNLAHKEAVLQQQQDLFNSKMHHLHQIFGKYAVENISQLKQCLDNWNSNQTRCGELEKEIAHLKKDREMAEKELQHQSDVLATANKEAQALESDITEISANRKHLFSDKNPDEEEQKLESLLAERQHTLQKRKDVFQALSTELSSQQHFVASKEKELQETEAKALTTQSAEELKLLYNEKKNLSENLLQEIGALQQTLKSNAEQQRTQQDKIQAKEKQQAIWEKWAVLNDLIGSADGKKYRNFAQELTFEYLIDLANQQLKKMSERYLLKRSGVSTDPFELSVIDNYQNGEERGAKNLSGGEKFIMSLSLALGLANMASKNMRIDTMFIDEGFGTLDPDYLDVALSALSSLQSDGKIIGIISHLTELKERIATHIEILPIGNGQSRIHISN